jgi:hypothetical protein
MAAEQENVRAASGVFLPTFGDLAPLKAFLENPSGS